MRDGAVSETKHNGCAASHCKKRLSVFPSPAGISLTKLSDGDGKTDNLFYSVQSARLSLQSSKIAPFRPPHPQASVAPLPLVPGGGTHSLAGEGAGGANSDEGTGQRLCYSRYYRGPDQGHLYPNLEVPGLTFSGRVRSPAGTCQSWDL